jgi:hypothetical protein
LQGIPYRFVKLRIFQEGSDERERRRGSPNFFGLLPRMRRRGERLKMFSKSDGRFDLGEEPRRAVAKAA